MAEPAGALIPVLPAEECARRLRRSNSKQPHLWSLLDAVKDPEIPVVSIWELGILQDIKQHDSGRVVVTITPTYSGCPAIEAITEDVTDALQAAGYAQIEVVKQLAPAWSSQWILPKARDALHSLGIVPPQPGDVGANPACPRCGSDDVTCLSTFGSTACKALYQCRACAEPFDYFKAF